MNSMKNEITKDKMNAMEAVTVTMVYITGEYGKGKTLYVHLNNGYRIRVKCDPSNDPAVSVSYYPFVRFVYKSYCCANIAYAPEIGMEPYEYFNKVDKILSPEGIYDKTVLEDNELGHRGTPITEILYTFNKFTGLVNTYDKLFSLLAGAKPKTWAGASMTFGEAAKIALGYFNAAAAGITKKRDI